MVMSMKTVKVVAAILQKDQEILIARRNYGDYSGKWEFPGGKVEAGETPQQALKREIEEELEEEIAVGDYLMTREYDYPAFHLSMRCYFCTLLHPENHMHLSSHDSVRWIRVGDQEPIDWIEADRAIYERVVETARRTGQLPQE